MKTVRDIAIATTLAIGIGGVATAGEIDSENPWLVLNDVTPYAGSQIKAVRTDHWVPGATATDNIFGGWIHFVKIDISEFSTAAPKHDDIGIDKVTGGFNLDLLY